MSLLLTISNFQRFYGMDAWYNPHYNTTDNIIPFKRFQQMYNDIPHVRASERLSDYYAHFHALAMVNSTDKTALLRLSEDEFNQANGG